MMAIQVRILPATDTKPTRLKASMNGHSVIRSVRDTDTAYDCLVIATELCKSLELEPNLVGGLLDNGDHVFCFHSCPNK